MAKKDVQARAAEHSDRMLEVLAELAEDPATSAKDRIAAAMAVLDRAHGKVGEGSQKRQEDGASMLHRLTHRLREEHGFEVVDMPTKAVKKKA